MVFSRYRWLAILAFCAPTVALAGAPKPCVSADQASQMLNKDICVSAHVYEVVQLPDGTRFLDVCSPETPDEKCRFTVVSLWEDRDAVGELKKYRDLDVQIRGMVQFHAWKGGNGAEPCAAVLRRAAKVQAQSLARARIQRRRKPPSR